MEPISRPLWSPLVVLTTCNSLGHPLLQVRLQHGLQRRQQPELAREEEARRPLPDRPQPEPGGGGRARVAAAQRRRRDSAAAAGVGAAAHRRARAAPLAAPPGRARAGGTRQAFLTGLVKVPPFLEPS